MYKFVTLLPLESFQYKKVKFYSVQRESQDVTEFEDFLNRMEDIPAVEEDLINLIVWIKEIGQKYGAQKKFFRDEGTYADASALPPPGKTMRLKGIEVRGLRLYCLRANEHVVILFNGGLKTSQKAQDCPNVATYFNQANQLAKVIDQLFQQREITWNESFTDIIFDENLQIEL